jgi:hypothetical protein
MLYWLVGTQHILSYHILKNFKLITKMHLRLKHACLVVLYLVRSYLVFTPECLRQQEMVREVNNQANVPLTRLIDNCMY